jgi:hypothetical protein
MQFFAEEQKFSPFKVLLIVLPAWVVTGYILGNGLYQQLVLEKPWGDEPMQDNHLILLTVFVNILFLGLLFMVHNVKLSVFIRESGIHFRFYPFMRREKCVRREEIERFEVLQYKPIRDYGGWGYRQRKHRFRNTGIAYNIRGNIGLQLYLVNGNKILFGTQRKEAIQFAMKKMMGDE